MRARGKAEIIQVNLRLHQDLRRRLMQGAKKAKRSLNAEIVARLEHSFQRAHADEVLKHAQDQYLGSRALYGIVAEKLDLPKFPGLLAPQEELDAYFRSRGIKK